ncbi:DNA alkylation repair protein [Eubacterium sp. 1001713B170207_170306_E7]|uniref:DNA alkylation repair protein n=1 Tax=Eubacterium sp. 1001713B170207_170306_E7 TaxID=2787097 RepID=UPI001896C515|nr:DNA alkylation repair protein [Eubacterium sp. 1001713B170207_170306_E7]
MAELLKDKYYNAASLRDLGLRIKAAAPAFPVERFVADTLDEAWQALGLKERMRQVTVNLGRYLSDDYARALAILDETAAGYPAGFNDYALMIFPDFVEVYGQQEAHWDLSVAALERYTPLSSAEFAVRPFIIRDEARMMRQMALWAGHDNAHVRRLASEGCRPQLPWGQALPRFKEDPEPVLAILERLKADPSLYVRKSVANNLNDISKTHPDRVAGLARKWYGQNRHTDWIVKHGCRTLLKKGNPEVLELFGFEDAASIEVAGFALAAAAVAIGQDLVFTFKIRAGKEARVRLEYGIDYVKANGRRSRKIFQISELSLKANQEKTYTKVQSFADLSTRKHCPGPHAVTLIVNGAKRGTLDFELLPAEGRTGSEGE